MDNLPKMNEGNTSSDDYIVADPVSYSLPGSTTIYQMDDEKILQSRYQAMITVENKPVKTDDAINTDSSSLSKNNTTSSFNADEPLLTVEERKKGWVEDPRKRVSNGRTDKFYYHLETNKMCRSLKEVHDFIKFGVSRRVQKKQEGEQQESRPAKKVKGGSLLRKEIVGTYSFKTRNISLHAEAVVDKKEVEPAGGAVEASSTGNDEMKLEDKEVIGESADAKNSSEEDKIVSYMNFEFI